MRRTGAGPLRLHPESEDVAKRCTDEARVTESIGSTKRIRPRIHPLLARALLVFGGILTALLIAEVALRVSGFTYFNPYVVDPDVGYSLRPRAEGWWKKEGLTYVKINSYGFHDREHTIAKPPDTLRIAVLGILLLRLSRSRSRKPIGRWWSENFRSVLRVQDLKLKC